MLSEFDLHIYLFVLYFVYKTYHTRFSMKILFDLFTFKYYFHMIKFRFKVRREELLLIFNVGLLKLERRNKKCFKFLAFFTSILNYIQFQRRRKEGQVRSCCPKLRTFQSNVQKVRGNSVFRSNLCKAFVHKF